jgi:hemolysin activation/secretion protein
LSANGCHAVILAKDNFYFFAWLILARYWRNDLRWSRPVAWSALRPVLAEYGASLGYDLGWISNDRYNGDQHGRGSSNSVELFARGQHLAASVTFAHSLERPEALNEREAPIYFSLSVFL